MCSSPHGRYGCGSLSTAGLSTACRALAVLCVGGRWGILSVSSGVMGKNPVVLQGKSEPCGFVIGVGDTGAS